MLCTTWIMTWNQPSELENGHNLWVHIEHEDCKKICTELINKANWEDQDYVNNLHRKHGFDD